MLWNIIDQRSESSGATNSRTVDRPGGVQVGDTIVAIWIIGVAGDRIISNFSLPDGWAMKYLEGKYLVSLTQPAIMVATKIARADEPSSYTFSYTGDARANCLLLGRISGAASGNVIDVVRSQGGAVLENNNATSAPITTPEHPDLPSASYLRLWVGVHRHITGTGPDWDITDPSDFTSAFSIRVASNFMGEVAFQQFSGGSASAIQSAFASSFSGNNLTAQFIFREMPAPDWEAIELRKARELALSPGGAIDPESSDLEDLGDFTEPTAPPFPSQKNMVRLTRDPRTGIIMGVQGADGDFGEVPATPQVISISRDCGRTWEQRAQVDDFIGEKWKDKDSGDYLWSVTYDTIQGITPGENPGEWLVFDFVGDYWFSDDNGATWSERRRAGIGILPFSEWEEDMENHYGLIGQAGQFNTRSQSPINQAGQIGFPFVLIDWDWYSPIGVRRSIGPNGDGGWENSIIPAAAGEGGLGWQQMQPAMPSLLGANDRWVLVATQEMTDPFGWPDAEGNLIINTSLNLNPGSWSSLAWTISKEYINDIMQGALATHLTASQRLMRAQNGLEHNRLVFTPIAGHPEGGRWWYMGIPGVLLLSDDNGVTWSNRLSDHRAPIDQMHPILAHREREIFTFPPRHSVTDIISDPFGSGILMSIGITYNRSGLSNRMAVFSMSVDGGDHWSPIGQLPIRLSAATDAGSSGLPGFYSPAIARYIFPCFRSDGEE